MTEALTKSTELLTKNMSIAIKIIKTMVRGVALHGSEKWTLGKGDSEKPMRRGCGERLMWRTRWRMEK